MHVRFHFAIDVAIARWIERRAGRDDRAQRAQLELATRADPGLLASDEKARTGAEDRDALVVREAPEHARIGLQRRAVEQHDRRAGREPARERVPHHPARRRVIEVAIVRAHVGMQRVLLQLLQQGAAGAMHDALGHAGRAGRVEDEGRVIERQLLERERRRAIAEVGEHHGVVDRVERGLLVHVGHEHDALDARDLFLDRAHGRHAIERLARVAIAVGGEQHLRRDLTEAIEHAARAEVRRTGRPDRAEARRREHRDHGFRQVRREARDAIAGLHAGGPQAVGDARRFAPQLAPRELPPLAALVTEDDRGSIVVAAQEIFGVVQPRIDEPARAGHAVAVLDDLRGARLRADLAEVPQRAPEILRELDRPAMQRGVVGHRRLVALAHETHESASAWRARCVPAKGTRSAPWTEGYRF